MTGLRRSGTSAALTLAALLVGAAPSYADTGDFAGAPEPGGGIPGWFVGFAVLAVLVGIGGMVWKVTTAQKLAKQSGMDPSLATQVTLLSDDGLDATYLASNLRQQPPPSTGPAPAPPPSAAARLEELKGLLDRGLVTQMEYDERRAAIIDSI